MNKNPMKPIRIGIKIHPKAKAQKHKSERVHSNGFHHLNPNPMNVFK